MTQAKTLRELLTIRNENRDIINKFDNNLGSALGFKITENKVIKEPAILIFFPQKFSKNILPPDQVFPGILKSASGLECKTDIIEGKFVQPRPIPPPLSDGNYSIILDLKKGVHKLIGGAMLESFDTDGEKKNGTIGCIVKKKSNSKNYILTNQHIAGSIGRPIYFSSSNSFRIGKTTDCFEYEIMEEHFPGLGIHPEIDCRLDCALVELRDETVKLSRPGLFGHGQLGPPLKFNLDSDSMEPLDSEVTSIGIGRGIQTGRIMAFGYELKIDKECIFTDFLILGDEGGVFSDDGDSGKLIVTKEGLQPVALLWGGAYDSLRRGQGQEKWSYAIEINRLLEKLNVEIL